MSGGILASHAVNVGFNWVPKLLFCLLKGPINASINQKNTLILHKM